MQQKYSRYRTPCICLHCGVSFFGSKDRKFCSLACGNAGKRRRKPPSTYAGPRPISTCSLCGASFEHRRDSQRKFCSRRCLFMHRERLSGTGDSFWNFVDKSGGPDACWPWTGHRNMHGYGRCRQSQGTQKAHRIAYARTHGAIPDDLHVCHRCDNPPCCNPSHLFLGTMKDNIGDASAKGRLRQDPAKHQGEKSGNARLTEAEVIQIRGRCAAGENLSRIAFSYGVTYSHIWGIMKRRSWTHI